MFPLIFGPVSVLTSFFYPKTQVHISNVNGQQQTTYDLGNGDFITNLTSPTEINLLSALEFDNATIPCCFKAKLIVYYDKSFADKWAAVPLNPVTKYEF